MAPYSLTWLPGVLRAASLKVIEQPGWQTRGHGDIGAIKGVLCHHTAECRDADVEPALEVITHGTQKLKGPLCQLGLGQDGTYWMIAAGKASHAGIGVWKGITAGNDHFIGIEAENDGIGEPWPDVQLDAYARGCAAILKHIKAGAIMCAGHKEYATPKGRKIDPNFDMDAFRERVATFLR